MASDIFAKDNYVSLSLETILGNRKTHPLFRKHLKILHYSSFPPKSFLQDHINKPLVRERLVVKVVTETLRINLSAVIQRLVCSIAN